MIRYLVSQQELERSIQASVPSWLRRAQRRTATFIRKRAYEERSSIWSEIKAVYMKVQHSKCAYCERRLADPGLGGAIEHDLEHFRPKSSVVPWPTAAMQAERDLNFAFELGAASAKGYYWLAYHPLNYCTSCKKCNSPLKSNHFPIAGPRGRAERMPVELHSSEAAFLIFPLGADDQDPEQLITFLGITAIPRQTSQSERRRAEVTIAFFELNRREELLRERAEALVSLDNALALLESNPTPERKAAAQEDVRRWRDASSPHASCVRCACELYASNRTLALELFAAARTYLRSLQR